MKTINEIFNEADLKDVRGAINKAEHPTRPYERKQVAENEKFNVPPVARFKCKVYFLDGNNKTFYSYDNITKPNNTYIKDEWNGLMKLLRMVNDWQGKYKTVMIWATLDKIPQPSASNYDFEVMKLTRYVNHQKDLPFNHKTGQLDVERIKFKQAKEWHLKQA